METYWIDKQGGSHYHKENCEMVKDPHYHYEPIIRRRRKIDKRWRLERIRASGKYYMPCACILSRRLLGKGR
jgi:hypothetical protein